MNEAEVKILDIDAAAIEKKLIEMGAEKVFEGDMQASLFDFPDGRLDREESFVRVRTKGEKIELVYKKDIPSEIANVKEELEVEVSDRSVTEEILKRLGLVEKVHGRNKHRISYSLENAHFEIDTIDGMPTFLEVEVSDSDKLAAWVEKLGYTMDDAKPWGSNKVYEYYGVEYPLVK